MSDQAKGVPDRGPLPQPRDPLEARDYLKASAFTAPLVDSVTLTTEEFTSVCPITGQPDFGTVTIEYRPSQLCIESRALKYYLWAYREEGAFCESVAARIADDIVYAIAPQRVEVRVTQKARGGIGIVATAVRPA
jgi:7-cyano-7-deazaguanine reductase